MYTVKLLDSKRYLFLVVYTMVIGIAMAQPPSLFNNRGASMYILPGAYMIVNNDSLYNHKGYIQNAGDLRIAGHIFNDDTLAGGPTTTTGLYDIGGNWVNSGTVISYNDSVLLNGNAQWITGTRVTPFHHLILAGTTASVKTQTIDATVSGILDLRDHELATQQQQMLVLNTAQGAITKSNGANGFVSSLDTGKLSRATNAIIPYFYPTGTPSSLVGATFYYRPITITPTSSASNIYGVRLAHDPSADTYDVNKLDLILCRVNPLYYHRMYHSQGSNAADIKMYFDATNDGAWTDMAHWGTASDWTYMGVPTSGSGIGFSTLEIKNWSNFKPHPFALGAKKFNVEAGPDQAIYTGQTTNINAIISTTSIASIVWTPATTLDADNVKDPKASPTETTQYVITVTDHVGCQVSDSITISLLPDMLLIPTAFSPNKDGLNDIFRPLNKNLNKIVFQVFNRWGEKVYETDQIGEGWDGTFKGVKQDMGVFAWQAQYQLLGSPQSLSASGNVTLVK